jgi:hypothetical protein
VLEELLGRDLETPAGGLGDDLDADDRVAAEIEEVVVDPDAVDAEDALPDLDQGALGVVARQGEGGVELGQV